MEKMIIENGVATWNLHQQGDISGLYTGTFKFRCFLSPMQQIAAGKEYRNILGESHLTAPEFESNLAYALTQLKYRIISAPPFWTSTLQNSTIEGDIADANIIMTILDAATTAELQYRDELKAKREKSLEVSKNIAESLLSK